MTKINCYYRRNLKMSADKLSAQVAHVVANLTRNRMPDEISVNAVGDDKFSELENTPRCYVQCDNGVETVLGLWDREE